MAFGRPRRRNDPSVMASVEAAISTVARPGPIAWMWHWRYEIGLTAGLALVGVASGDKLGAAGLIAITAAGLALLVAALIWPPARKRLIARAWCVITPHRVRTGCRRASVRTADGRPPKILYTTPAAFGERVTLWCPAGITYGDFGAARAALRAACWASDARVLASVPPFVVLEIIRRRTAGPRGEADPAWPDMSRGGGANSADPVELALHGGPAHHRPFG
jgi:hypothetical protein